MKNFKLILILIFLISFSVFGQVRLPKLIGNGMVLQRDTDIKIWGWAKDNEKISINFNNSDYETISNDLGEWKITLPKMTSGGPYAMIIKASNTITINDILIGDVWICSGQSNMELPMKRVAPIYESEIANSGNKFIRYFAVPQKYNFNIALKDLESGEWKAANPENVLNFSAAAYFFAREIYEKYKIPVGLINASLGGSPAEAWISEESLKSFPEYYDEVQKFKDSSLITKIETADKIRIDKWYNELKQKDEGYKNPQKSWFDPSINTSDWAKMKIPGYWFKTKLGAVNGAVWFKREFNVPNSAAGKKTKLILGRIVDADSVFINGIFTGTISYQYPPRRYDISPNILKPGKNTIVVRVVSNSGNGGFVLDKPYEIISGKTEN